ncbi:peptidase T-like protein [Halobacteroides halobius DSM 5150]|uniref:Peptidase T-like protein n=1 Tax=Halobacteroides halobius (strain ATCC 35273 / DSM 5150 / MD-1) TaxID=748449 RepID=L0K860_HALHC|nr:M20/M25/M40 family metallo-hydrolase [Halobacteroides halobius]AGB40549.1 peptidase T-like protein [Halobacteroides halobius DSM 5150]
MNEEQIVKRFKELVQIDSISKEEGAIADYLVELLTELGLDVTVDDTNKRVAGETGNIIAKLSGDSSKPTLLLSAHLDTVTPGKGVKPVVKDGVIYSQGETILGADDKAGITAIVEALRIIKEGDLEHGDLEIVFTVGEEIGLLGAKNLDYNLLSADFGVTYDSSGQVGTIITQAPAQNKLEVKVEGKSAHAGMNPSLGINAIKVASLAISNMNLGQIDEETTANIGVIKGGQATNIVPDLVELEGEVRSRNERKLEKQTEHMIDLFKRAARKYQAQIEISHPRMYSAFELQRNSKIVDIAIKAAHAINIKPKLQATGGGSDANIFNNQEIPTINLGVGMEKVHSTEEKIKVNDLVDAVKYSVTLLQQAAK